MTAKCIESISDGGRHWQEFLWGRAAGTSRWSGFFSPQSGTQGMEVFIVNSVLLNSWEVSVTWRCIRSVAAGVCVVKGDYLCLCPPLGQLHTESRYNKRNNLQHSNRAHVSHFTTCYCTTTGKPRWYSPFAIHNIHFFAIGIKKMQMQPELKITVCRNAFLLRPHFMPHVPRVPHLLLWMHSCQLGQSMPS